MKSSEESRENRESRIENQESRIKNKNQAHADDIIRHLAAPLKVKVNRKKREKRKERDGVHWSDC